MLTFNDLLVLEGIDTTKVRLVRHQDGRIGAGRLYGAWRNDRDAFEDYQSVQSRDVFPMGDLLASFIVTEARKTVSLGMYRVDGVGTCPPGSIDALLKHDVSGQFRYELQLVDRRRCDAPLRYAASGTSTRAPSRSMVSAWAMTGEP